MKIVDIINKKRKQKNKKENLLKTTLETAIKEKIKATIMPLILSLIGIVLTIVIIISIIIYFYSSFLSAKAWLHNIKIKAIQTAKLKWAEMVYFEEDTFENMFDKIKEFLKLNTEETKKYDETEFVNQIQDFLAEILIKASDYEHDDSVKMVTNGVNMVFKKVYQKYVLNEPGLIYFYDSNYIVNNNIDQFNSKIDLLKARELQFGENIDIFATQAFDFVTGDIHKILELDLSETKRKILEENKNLIDTKNQEINLNHYTTFYNNIKDSLKQFVERVSNKSLDSDEVIKNAYGTKSDLFFLTNITKEKVDEAYRYALNFKNYFINYINNNSNIKDKEIYIAKIEETFNNFYSKKEGNDNYLTLSSIKNHSEYLTDLYNNTNDNIFKDIEENKNKIIKENLKNQLKKDVVQINFPRYITVVKEFGRMLKEVDYDTFTYYIVKYPDNYPMYFRYKPDDKYKDFLDKDKNLIIKIEKNNNESGNSEEVLFDNSNIPFEIVKEKERIMNQLLNEIDEVVNEQYNGNNSTIDILLTKIDKVKDIVEYYNKNYTLNLSFNMSIPIEDIGNATNYLQHEETFKNKVEDLKKQIENIKSLKPSIEKANLNHSKAYLDFLDKHQISNIPQPYEKYVLRYKYSLREIVNEIGYKYYPEYFQQKIGGNGFIGNIIDSALNNTNTTGNKIVEYAKQFIGTPYLWGGTTPKGFDCSGFVQYIYKHFGINLPRVSKDQAKVGITINSVAEAQPGDLVFFGNPIHHVGIYVGNNEYIHAPQTGDVVKISSLTKRRPSLIKRILKNTNNSNNNNNNANTNNNSNNNSNNVNGTIISNSSGNNFKVYKIEYPQNTHNEKGWMVNWIKHNKAILEGSARQNALQWAKSFKQSKAAYRTVIHSKYGTLTEYVLEQNLAADYPALLISAIEDGALNYSKRAGVDILTFTNLLAGLIKKESTFKHNVSANGDNLLYINNMQVSQTHSGSYFPSKGKNHKATEDYIFDGHYHQHSTINRTTAWGIGQQLMTKDAIEQTSKEFGFVWGDTRLQSLDKAVNYTAYRLAQVLSTDIAKKDIRFGLIAYFLGEGGAKKAIRQANADNFEEYKQYYESIYGTSNYNANNLIHSVYYVNFIVTGGKGGDIGYIGGSNAFDNDYYNDWLKIRNILDELYDYIFGTKEEINLNVFDNGETENNIDIDQEDYAAFINSKYVSGSSYERVTIANIQRNPAFMETEYHILIDGSKMFNNKEEKMIITSLFNPARNISGSYKVHAGIDMVGANNIPNIHAIDSGTIIYAGEASGYGKVIVFMPDSLKNKNGAYYTLWFGHVTNLKIKTGDRVVNGQKLATMGNEGTSTGTHLHLEIRLHYSEPQTTEDVYKGMHLNPLLYINFNNYSISSSAQGYEGRLDKFEPDKMKHIKLYSNYYQTSQETKEDNYFLNINRLQ